MQNNNANRRKKRKNNNIYSFISLLLMIIIVGYLLYLLFTGQGKDKLNNSSSTSISDINLSSSVSDVVSSDVNDSDSSYDSNKDSSSRNLSSEESSSSKPSSENSSEPTALYYEEDLPILVNPTNKLPKDYDPTLVEIQNGYKLDEKAAAAAIEMFTAAKKDGINLTVISAYRSPDYQEQVFARKVKEYQDMGYDKDEATTKAAKFVAIPGTSEHSLGLAMDLNSLYQNFDQTKEYKWLIENCTKFGFINRYPEDKTDITKINFEPWHYRYVGINHAEEIVKNGYCLEEYLGKD